MDRDGSIRDSSEIMSDEDLDALEEFNKVKRHIMSYFDREKLIEKIKNIIIESDRVEFSTSRAKKFINSKKPVFIISLKENKDEREEFKSREDEVNYFSDVVHEEIIHEFSTFIFETLDDERNEIGDSTFFQDGESPDPASLATLVVSSIFGLRMELERNLVYVEYMI